MSGRKRYGTLDEPDETTDGTTDETTDTPADPVGTPEQLTAAVRFLAGRIGGAAASELDFILGIPAPPVSQ